MPVHVFCLFKALFLVFCIFKDCLRKAKYFPSQVLLLCFNSSLTLTDASCVILAIFKNKKVTRTAGLNEVFDYFGDQRRQKKIQVMCEEFICSSWELNQTKTKVHQTSRLSRGLKNTQQSKC